jgi:hypothetical protein
MKDAPSKMNKVKISFKRLMHYFWKVLLYTARDTADFMLRIRDDTVKTLVIFTLYIIALFVASRGLLELQAVENFFAPIGGWAQFLLMVGVLIVFVVFRLVLYTPVELYYEQKKKADKDSWDDVHFGEILPQIRNLLGIAVVVKNDQLANIENLSVWIVGIWPESVKGVECEKRFGYVEDYENDKEPVYADVDAEVGEEKIFVMANYDEKDGFSIRARGKNLNDSTDEIKLPLEGAYVLDIEYRARWKLPKTIRYVMVFEENPISISFYKYGVKYRKFKK